MQTDEGTDGQTDKTEGYTEGRTPFKRIGSFRDYAKATKSNFSLHWHQNLLASAQYNDGRKQACLLVKRHPGLFSSPRWEDHRCFTVPYITMWSRDEWQ